MGGKVKAPWANSTPEEDEAYALAMGFDVEFEAEIAEQMGPYGKSAIDSSKARFHKKGKGWTLKGTYVPKDYDTDVAFKTAVDKRYSEVLNEIESDTVNIISAEDANPRIWSHEFRHRFAEQEDDEHVSEYENRLWDIYRSKNNRQFVDALMLFHNGYGSDSVEETFDRVKSLFTLTYARRFSNKEAKQAEKTGTAIPKEKSYWLNLPGESLDIERGYKDQNPKDFYYDRYKKRSKNWRLENSPRYEQIKKEAKEEAELILELERRIQKLSEKIKSKYGEE